LYWAFALPATAVVFVVQWVWERHSRRRESREKSDERRFSDAVLGVAVK